MGRKRILCLLLALLTLLSTGCGLGGLDNTLKPVPEGLNTKPIFSKPPDSGPVVIKPGSVVASYFEGTVVLAHVSIAMWEGKEPVREARDVSQGGRIACKDKDGRWVTVRQVLIMEELVPYCTADWFRDLPQLTYIQGAEKLKMSYVTDMSHMFSGCTALSSLDADEWNVSGVENMVGIFDGCTALREKPVWYTEE